MNNEQAFIDYLVTVGITGVNDIISDGKWHAFTLNDESKSKKSGRYTFSILTNGHAFGTGYNWKEHQYYSWSSFDTKNKTKAQLKEYYQAKEVVDKANEIKQLDEQAIAKQKLIRLWNNANDCVEHKYLENKAISSYGLKEYNGMLLVPVRNDGELVALQYIKADGEKRFNKDVVINGNYNTIGNITKNSAVAYICEGYSTGATIHEVTGYPVICTFHCHNLLPVAKKLKVKYPNVEWVVAGDNDILTERNDGLTKAKETAKKAKMLMVVPDFGNYKLGTDFNDLLQYTNIEEVRKQLTPKKLAYYDKVASLVHSFDDFKTCEFEQPMPITDWLRSGDAMMLYAPTGAGKSYFAINMAYSITSRQEFLGWQIHNNTGVLYIDAEMPRYDIQQRFKSLGYDKVDKPFNILSSEDFIEEFNTGMFLNEKHNQDAILMLMKSQPDIKVIFIDNINSCVQGEENNNDAWFNMLGGFVDKCRYLGVAVVLIHHAGKSGDQKGSTAKLQALTTIVHLEPVGEITDGVQSKIQFKKGRNVTGGAIKPRIFSLVKKPDSDIMEFVVEDVEQVEKQQVFNAIKGANLHGVSMTALSKDLNLEVKEIEKYTDSLFNDKLINREGKRLIVDNIEENRQNKREF